MIETWVPVPAWEGLYDVSDRGRVYSFRAGRFMAHILAAQGRYPSVRLSQGSRRELAAVHVIELTAFAGPCPPGMQARHLNDIRTDLRWPKNLAWGTPHPNGQDKVRNGHSASGEHNARSKLTVQQVLEIRKRLAAGAKTYHLAREFGVVYTTIWTIGTGRRWAHLLSQ